MEDKISIQYVPKSIYDPLKYQLKSLKGKYNKISNTLYLRNLDEIQRRISRKKTSILGTGQKI